MCHHTIIVSFMLLELSKLANKIGFQKIHPATPSLKNLLSPKRDRKFQKGK